MQPRYCSLQLPKIQRGNSQALNSKQDVTLETGRRNATISLIWQGTLGGLLLGLGLTGGYVAALYILPHQLSRDHRQTVQRRMACTLGYCCLAWMPVYLFLGCQVINSVFPCLYIMYLEMGCLALDKPPDLWVYRRFVLQMTAALRL